MVANLVFDLGHVLIDIDPKRTLHAIGQLIDKVKIGATNTDSQPLITADGLLGGHTSRLIDAYQVGQITTRQFAQTVQQYCREGVTEQQIMDAWLAMLLPFKSEKAQLLRNLHAKGIPFYILSNINESHVLWTRQNCPELQLAAGLFFSNEIQAAKPDDHAYQILLDKTGICPEQTLYIDDLPANIEAGKRFGFQCLQATDDLSWMPQVEQLLA